MIATRPGALDVTVPAGGNAGGTLYVENVGTRDLDWHLRDTVSAAPPPSDARIPGFAYMATTFESLVTFDVAEPEGSLVEINNDLRRILHAGDFVDNDFSQLYAFDWNSTQLVMLVLPAHLLPSP